MSDARSAQLASIISRASLEHRQRAVRRFLAVTETEALQAIGHSASAAVVAVANDLGVTPGTVWRWRARVRGEFDPLGQLRWLLDRAAHRNSEILSLEEAL